MHGLSCRAEVKAVTNESDETKPPRSKPASLVKLVSQSPSSLLLFLLFLLLSLSLSLSLSALWIWSLIEKFPISEVYKVCKCTVFHIGFCLHCILVVSVLCWQLVTLYIHSSVSPQANFKARWESEI